jgi:hypothetical protein
MLLSGHVVGMAARLGAVRSCGGKGVGREVRAVWCGVVRSTSAARRCAFSRRARPDAARFNRDWAMGEYKSVERGREGEGFTVARVI